MAPPPRFLLHTLNNYKVVDTQTNTEKRATRAQQITDIFGRGMARPNTFDTMDTTPGKKRETPVNTGQTPVFIHCPERGSNPHGPFGPQDFKS